VGEQQRFDPVARREVDQVCPVQVGRQEFGETFAGGRIEMAAAGAEQKRSF
jgi:hypothetical protein